MTRFTFPRPHVASPGPGGHRRRVWPAAAAVVTAAALATMTAAASPAGAGVARFQQVNMVSDIPGLAPLTDPDLVNAWGLAASPGTDQAPGSPLWVSDNGTDKTTVFAGRRWLGGPGAGGAPDLRRSHRSGVQPRPQWL